MAATVKMPTKTCWSAAVSLDSETIHIGLRMNLKPIVYRSPGARSAQGVENVKAKNLVVAGLALAATLGVVVAPAQAQPMMMHHHHRHHMMMDHHHHHMMRRDMMMRHDMMHHRHHRHHTMMHHRM